jgi:hypothetical protein
MRVYIIVILVVLLSGFLVVFYFNRSTFAGSSSLTAGNPCPEGIRLKLEKPYAHESGYAYIANVPEREQISDTMDAPNRSPVVLCEDGRMLGPAHSLHEEVRKQDGGRFSHWGTFVMFASSDNSDPNANGREYVIIVPGGQ